MPFEQRKKIIEKCRSRTSRKTKPDSRTAAPEVATGAQVCLRSAPIYHSGKITYLLPSFVCLFLLEISIFRT